MTSGFNGGMPHLAFWPTGAPWGCPGKRTLKQALTTYRTSAPADDLPYEPQGKGVVPCKRLLQQDSDDRQLWVE
jgi:hypothetical protein